MIWTSVGITEATSIQSPHSVVNHTCIFINKT